MNRKTTLLLSKLDQKTLTDICYKEKLNESVKKNLMYDLGTKEMFEYDNDTIYRPLKNRLLYNGVRLNMDTAKILSELINNINSSIDVSSLT